MFYNILHHLKRGNSDDLARDEEKPQYEVTVAPFRIAITPVTVELYREVMFLRSAFRFDGGGPVYRYKFSGFRCVRVPPQQVD